MEWPIPVAHFFSKIKSIELFRRWLPFPGMELSGNLTQTNGKKAEKERKKTEEGILLQPLKFDQVVRSQQMQEINSNDDGVSILIVDTNIGQKNLQVSVGKSAMV